MAKKNQVKAGQIWEMRLTTGRFVNVRIIGQMTNGGYDLEQLDSGRRFRIRTAGKLRRLISNN